MVVEAIQMRHPVSAVRFPGLAWIGLVARRASRGALLWAGVFGITAWSLATQFTKEYPTPAARAMLVATMGTDVGSQAIFGPAHHLGTVAGYTAYHLAVVGLLGGVWGLLAATRLMRGEEEAGRWELLLAGQTTQRRAAASALMGLGGGLLTLWAVTAAAIVAVGRGADARFSVGASMFLALATIAATATFMAVGALCSQVAATRRRAAGLAAAVFGVAYLLRALSVSGPSLRWLRWVTPIGWIDELRPLTGSRPLMLVPIVGTIVALLGVTIVLAGRRDLGAGLVPAHDTAPPRTRLLCGPLGLAARLERGTAIGWIVGLGAGGLVLGLSTRTMEDVWADQASGVWARLGGASGGATYLGLLFLVVSVAVAVAGAGQVAATREEEAEGYLDHLLARQVGRASWLTGRVAVAAAALVAAGAVTGLLTWVGATTTGSDVGLGAVVAAGINTVPAAIFVLGVGTLVHGVAPRYAAPVAYGVVVWSFVVEVIGASLGASRWLLDLSVLHHLARAPATPVRWDTAAILVALGIAAAAVGAWRLVKRDLVGA